MKFIDPTGAPAEVVKPRREPPTPRQMGNRRHALWLHARQVGLFDPATGITRPHSVAELAALWGVTPRAVRLGIDLARQFPRAGGID